MTRQIDDIIHANRAGRGTALPSVCSARPDVQTASPLLAQSLDQPLLVEATSRQVTHRGGYTGRTSWAFIAMLRARAARPGTDLSRLLFGGDRLGPQARKDRPAEAAMWEARPMIAALAEAGFTKINLDGLDSCAGEPVVQEAIEAGIDAAPASSPLFAQYLPQAAIGRAETLPLPRAEALLVTHVQEALIPCYAGTS